MSFSSEVKKELLSIEDTSNCCKNAMLFGILQNNSDIVFNRSGIKLIVKSHILSIIHQLRSHLSKQYDIETMIKYGDEKNINKLRYYYLEITGDTSGSSSGSFSKFKPIKIEENSTNDTTAAIKLTVER